MLKKKINESQFVYNFQIKEHIPKDHFLRLVEENINFDFIYEKVKHLYSHTGQPAIDPAVLIKMLLIGYFYNIKSERQLVKEVQVNIAYRWFIKYNIDEKIPDHSTISQTRRRKFKDSKLFQEIFDQIIRKCIEKGFVNGETILSDSTYIKANASLDSLKELPKKINEYFNDLEINAEIEKEEENESKKEQKEEKPKRKISNQTHISKTDPESKLADKKCSGFSIGLYYHEHRSMDLSGYITDVHVTPANIKEHQVYQERILRQKLTYQLPIKNLVYDRACGVPDIYKKMSELGFNLFIAQKTEGRKQEGYFERKDFRYIKEKDMYLCPAGQILKNNGLDESNNCFVYSGEAIKCKECKIQEQCIKSKSPKRFKKKTFRRHVNQNIIDKVIEKKIVQNGNIL